MSNESSKVNVVSILLSIIAGLISFFGTLSLDRLNKMSERIEALALDNVRQEKDIQALQQTDARHENHFSEFQRLFAMKEDEYELKPPYKQKQFRP